MLRIVDWIIGREPVATATGLAGVVTALLGLAAAFGADITPEQIAAIGALAVALAGWLARKAVSPVTTPTARKAERLFNVQDVERMQDGSIPLALLILIGLAVLLLLGLGVCTDALFHDEDESNDLGFRVELVSHERARCDDGYDCDNGDDWGGGSDGNSGGEYEGGRSGDQGDGDGQCRNFCNITVPTPGGGEQPQSLFPPTPDAVRQFVLATVKAGIELGRLFADTTITFVSNLLVGIA